MADFLEDIAKMAFGAGLMLLVILAPRLDVLPGPTAAPVYGHIEVGHGLTLPAPEN